MHHLLADGPYCQLHGEGRVIVGTHADIEQFVFISRVEGHFQMYNKMAIKD